jgi:hypothetical protein
MFIFRPPAMLAVVALFFALYARGDQVLGPAADRNGRQEIISAAPIDVEQAEPAATVVRPDLDEILKTALDTRSDGAAGIVNFLTLGSELDADSEIYDIEFADQDAGGEVVTVAKRSKTGIGDLLAPSGMFLLGTALAIFAFLSRSKRHHSRRAYYSRHSVVALPRSRTPLQTSPSAGSCKPNPHENSVHSSPRKRLA